MPLSPADLPPELFPFVLAYVGTDRWGRRRDTDGRRDLTSCALVCLDWATRCREYLFRDRTITMKALADVCTLDVSRVGGCTRLTPLIDLLGGITVVQDWQSSTTYRRVYTSSPDFMRALGTKAFTLSLDGAVSTKSPRGLQRSPPWICPLPRSMPPAFLPFSKVKLSGIRLSCPLDLNMLLGHFETTWEMDLFAITWGPSNVSWIPLRDPAALKKSTRDGTRFIAIARHCTNNFLACALASARLAPYFLSLFYVADGERDACFALLKASSGADHNGTTCNEYTLAHDLHPYFLYRLIDSIEGIPPWFRITGYATLHDSAGLNTDPDETLDVTLELQCEASVGPNRALEAIRIIGIRVNLEFAFAKVHPLFLNEHQLNDSSWQVIPYIIKTLHAQLVAQTFPHLRVVEVCAALHALKHAVKLSPEISRVPVDVGGGQGLYCWACDRRSFEDTGTELPNEYDRYQMVSVDPLTFEPSGRGWGERHSN